MNQIELIQNETLDILFYGLCFFTALYLVRFFFQTYRLAFYKLPTTPIGNSKNYPPVSIVVCARDEADNLTNFLPELLAQEYPDFEVIIVNDCSNDHTDDVLREFARLFDNLKVITVKEDDYYKHGKKFALMVGIKGAKYEHLLLTDADCVPSSRNWISRMMEGYEERKEIVLGYAPYKTEDGFLNKIIRFDTLMIGISYLSAALQKKTYMGVGRNLSYKKELFFKSKNFSRHYHIISGDDDLFINQVANSHNTAIVVQPDSFTYSIPKKTWRGWRGQKLRHLTTAPYYSSPTRTYLFLNHSLNYLSFLLAVSALFFQETRTTGIIALTARWLIQLIIFAKCAQLLKEKGIIAYWILFDVFFLLIYPFLSVSQKIYRPAKWMN